MTLSEPKVPLSLEDISQLHNHSDMTKMLSKAPSNMLVSCKNDSMGHYPVCQIAAT